MLHIMLKLVSYEAISSQIAPEIKYYKLYIIYIYEINI